MSIGSRMHATSLHGISTAVWVAALALGCVAPPSSDPAGSQVEDAFVYEVPVDYEGDLPIIEARVEGLDRPLRLVLDTGSGTMLSAAASAGATSREDASVAGGRVVDSVGRPIEFVPVLLDRMEVGSLEFRDLPAMIVSSPLFSRFCPPVDGVLGTGGMSDMPGFFERVSVQIPRDGPWARISRASSSFEGGVALPLRTYFVGEYGQKIDTNQMMIPVLIEEKLRWAILDTGSNGLSTMTLDVFTGLGRSLEDPDVRRYVGSIAMTPAGATQSTTPSWIASIAPIQVGVWELESHPFRIVEPREDGLPVIVLEQELLQHFNFVVDYRSKRVLVELADNDTPVGMLPLQLGWTIEVDRVVIVSMMEGGAAERAGVALGDEVLEVAGHRVDGRRPESVCRARQDWRRSNTTLRLRLRRDGREFEVVLPRSEPIERR